MGNVFGTDSKSKSTIITDVAFEVIQKHVARCTVTATQTQLIDVRNVVGDVTIDGATFRQGASVDASCVFSASTQTDIQSEIAAGITAYAEAQGIAIFDLLSSTSAEVETEIQNIFKTSISTESVQEAVVQSLQAQSIVVADVGGNVVIANVSMDQSIDMVVEAIMDSEGYASAISTVQSEVDAKAKATSENPLDPIFDMISAGIKSYAVVIIGVVLVGGLAFIFLTKYLFTTETGAMAVGKAFELGEKGMSMTPAGQAASFMPGSS